jgi:transposase
MAGRFEGLSDWAWHLCADIFPLAPMTRGRGLPPTPLRHVVNPLLSGLITGCRGCDLPRGPQGASQSAAQRWLQRWQADGPRAAMHARLLGRAEAPGMLPGQDGAIDGALSPWPRRR